MMRSGSLYELPMSEHHTKENGYSSWPTPTASDAEGGVRWDKGKRRLAQKLKDEVAIQIVHDSKNNINASEARRHTPALSSQFGGMLNPDWVELLMGFPKDWTRLGKGIGKKEHHESRKKKKTESIG
jgi:hypothetical protein